MFFSGRRRPGDYQSQVEKLLGQYDIQGHVLMLDLALSDTHDVTKPQLVHQLLRWITQRAVVALLVAPPCETWSEARHLPGEVRPLRDHLHPFGLEGLVQSELQQLWISSYLLFVSLRLFMAAIPLQGSRVFWSTRVSPRFRPELPFGDCLGYKPCFNMLMFNGI